MSFVIPRRALVVAALALIPAAALAHGPSRQKVVEKIEIDAPPAKVWAIVGNFGDLSWLPGSPRRKGRAAIRRIRPSARSPSPMAA